MGKKKWLRLAAYSPKYDFTSLNLELIEYFKEYKSNHQVVVKFKDEDIPRYYKGYYIRKDKK